MLGNVEIAIRIFVNDRAARIVRMFAFSTMVRTRLTDDPARNIGVFFRWNVVQGRAADLDLFSAAPGDTRLLLMNRIHMAADSTGSAQR